MENKWQKKIPHELIKGISLCPGTHLPLYGHILKNWFYSKRWLKIQHRKVLYPISQASKPDVYGQLEARTLHISSSYRFSLCFPLWHIINSIKSHWLKYQLAQLKYLYLYLVLNKNSIYGITWGKQNPVHFLTLLQLTCVTEAALCHLLLVKDPWAELGAIFTPAHNKLHFKASRAFISLSHEKTVLVHLEDTYWNRHMHQHSLEQKPPVF